LILEFLIEKLVLFVVFNFYKIYK